MLLDADDCQLVLVDYQSRLLPALYEGPAALANALRLAQLAQALQRPIWGTEQTPDKLGSNPAELKALCRQTLVKTHFSAVADGLIERLMPPASKAPPAAGGNARSLPKHLRKPQPAEPEPDTQTVVIAGCEAHVCLLQTALDLIEQEWDVVVVTDACASRTERNRDAAFDRLAGAGAELVTTEMVAFEWIRDARHPAFKTLLSLVK